MAAGVACGLQNRYGARLPSRVGSTPTRSRHVRGRCGGAAVALAAALLVPGSGLRAQEPEAATPDSSLVGERQAPVSTRFLPDSSQSLALERDIGKAGGGVGLTQRPPVSPRGAFFRSLVLPGWGQASVDQPVRGAFYFAMEAGSLWMLFKTQAKLDAARRARNEDLADLRSDQKEDWIVVAVFVALFSGVDAWVSAHLWDFEGAVVPPPDGSPGVAVRYSMPVGLP